MHGTSNPIRRTLPLLLLAGVVISPAVVGSAGAVPEQVSDSGQELDVDEARRAARERLLADLEELVAWCTKKKIFVERLKVYEAILYFDPENEDAKRGQGFVKDKEGNWTKTERRVPPKNWNKAAVREFPDRRAAVTAGYRRSMLFLLEEHAESLTARERERILDDLLVADPDDAVVHAERGEVKLDERWVLKETAFAKKRRGELRKIVQEAFGSAPKPREGGPNAKERTLGLEWSAVFATPVARALGTGSEKEIRRLPDAMHAALAYFEGALSLEAKYPEDFTVYTLAHPGESTTFLANHPVIDDAYRDFLTQLDGSLIQGAGDSAHWAETEQRRLDGLVRQAIAWLFAQSCGISPEDGWIFEGFGLYMTRELVGTRLTWFVKPSEYLLPEKDQALIARLLDTRTNWMNEANEILRGERPPRLEFLLGKTVNSLTTEDLLYAYVLAAFLLEARPDVIPGLLREIGGGATSQKALEKALGEDLHGIDTRVRRWLSERR